MKRRGFTAESIAALKRAYRTLYRSGLGLSEATGELERQRAHCAEIQPLLDFIAASTRGIIR